MKNPFDTIHSFNFIISFVAGLVICLGISKNSIAIQMVGHFLLGMSIAIFIVWRRHNTRIRQERIERGME